MSEDDKAVAIPITEKEGRVLARLLMWANDDTSSGLTADVAVGLLEKLRHANYEGNADGCETT